VIVIFKLEGSPADQVERVRLIQDNIKAKAFICFNSPRFSELLLRNEELLLRKQFLNRVVYAINEKDLKYRIINEQGFHLASCLACGQTCTIM
jgi:hypothetical protein